MAPRKRHNRTTHAPRMPLMVEALEDRAVPAFLAAVGDFNNDHIDDHLMIDSSNETAQVLLGSSDGAFQAGPSFDTLQWWTGSAGVGDFNGDGNLDVALGGLTDDYSADIRIFLGHGDGSVQAGDSFGLPEVPFGTNESVSQEPYDILVGDLNNDGRLDLAVVGAVIDYGMIWTGDDFYLNVLPGNGDGAFASGLTLYPLNEDSFTTVGGVELGDFDGDGNLDALSCTVTYFPGSEIVLHRGTGDGRFEPGTVVAVFAEDLWLTATGDYNGDGNLDAQLLNYSDGSTTVLLGNGDGAFQTDEPAEEPPAPSLSISDVTVVEGNSGTTTATFIVTLSAASSESVTVSFSTADGAATAGGDYEAASGTLIFAPGESSQTVTVLVNGDRVGEPNETFFVNLSGAISASIADGQGIGTILDDEPRVSIGDVSKQEGKKGKTTLFTFTVTLSAAYDQPVTMSFKTVNGTATTANKDYVAKSGTLTFAPGETTKTITIEVKGDSKKEANENFYVDLFGLSSNALFTKNRGVGTILNDD